MFPTMKPSRTLLDLAVMGAVGSAGASAQDLTGWSSSTSRSFPLVFLFSRESLRVFPAIPKIFTLVHV